MIVPLADVEAALTAEGLQRLVSGGKGHQIHQPLIVDKVDIAGSSAAEVRDTVAVELAHACRRLARHARAIGARGYTWVELAPLKDTDLGRRASCPRPCWSGVIRLVV